MNLINIVSLCKKYHTPTKEIIALDNITFNIEEGKILGIIGTSGCGKSTLFNIITKLEKQTSGYIKENKKLKIGYMMQTDALLPWLTVYENAILGLKLKKILTKENIEYVNSLLKKYGLFEFSSEYPNNLSGGMRQRVALIRTLAIKPNILLLDEPFSKLDIDSRIKISDDVYKIIKELKITAVIISHDIMEGITLCDSLVVLTPRPGKIKKIVKLEKEEKLPSELRKESYMSKLYEDIWDYMNDE